MLTTLSLPALSRRACSGRSLGVDCDLLKQEAIKRLKGDQEAEQPKKKRQVRAQTGAAAAARGSLLASRRRQQEDGCHAGVWARGGEQAEKEGPKMMDEYCKDLCAEVRAGRIDPVIGREREVSRVTQVRARSWGRCWGG